MIRLGAGCSGEVVLSSPAPCLSAPSFIFISDNELTYFVKKCIISAKPLNSCAPFSGVMTTKSGNPASEIVTAPQAKGQGSAQPTRVNPTRERREYDFRYNGDIFSDEKYVGAIDMYGEIWLKDGILEELPFDDYPPVEEDIRKELRRQMIEEVPPEDWVSEWIKCVSKETLPQNLVRIYEDKWGIGPQSTAVTDRG